MIEIFELSSPIQQVILGIQVVSLFGIGFVISLWVNAKQRQLKEFQKISNLDRILQEIQEDKTIAQKNTTRDFSRTSKP